MRNERFTRLYNQYSNLIYQYIYVRVKDDNLAMEMLQQVFVNFYEHMDSVSDDIVKPWLILCCKNEMIDYYRKVDYRKRSTFYDIGIEEEIMVADNAECVVERLANRELTFHILECLKAKNESWYQIIEAVAIMQMTNEEAAEYLHMSPQVLYAKLYRARKYIRRKFGEEYSNL